MERSDGKPNASLLSRFDQLASLQPEHLEALADQINVIEAPEGTRLVELGSSDSDTLFLVSGRVRLEADDGRISFVADNDPAARNPLCRLRPSRWRALAASRVRYLRISEELISSAGSSSGIAGYEVTELGDGLDDISETIGELLIDLVGDLDSRRLFLPSLPEIARLVSRRVLAAGHDAGAIAEALLLDPALTLKVVYAANCHSPVASPVRNCRAAVERLGPEAVLAMVVRCSFVETFRPPVHDPAATRRFAHWWRQSLLTGILARELAGGLAGLDPALAELCGLTHDIGHGIMLYQAARLAHEDPDRLPLNGQFAKDAHYIGRLLLGRWLLPAEVSVAAERREHWFDDGSTAPGYADITLVARRLAMLDAAPEASAPPLSDMPVVKRHFSELSQERRVAALLSAARARVPDATAHLDA
jgi:HD-like signal output (HDOD) protein